MRLVKNNKKKLNNKGFTLIEVLLSITILTLITIPLMKYFQDSLRYSKITEERQRATLTAQETFETMKANDLLISRVPDPDDISKNIYAFPALTEKDTFTVVNDSDFDSQEGKGKVLLKKSVLSSDMKYEVFVELDTTISANATQRATIYGIDNDDNVIVVEQSEEMDALWYFLQLNNSYVVSQQGFASDIIFGEDDDDEDGAGTSGTGTSGTGTGGTDDVDMLENIDMVREFLQRDIYITIGRENLAPHYYTVKVEYEYSCNKKIAEKPVGEDLYRTSPLIDDRVSSLKGIYLMYNIVNPDTDKVHVIWDSSTLPTEDQVPEILLVCQNLDCLLGVAGTLPTTEAVPGGLTPVYFLKDKATIKIDCSSELNGKLPVIRTNFKSAVTGENDKAIFLDAAGASYDPNKIKPLTSNETPVRVVDVLLKVYKHDDSVTDYWNDATPLVEMTTSKGE